jgi:hypothetical protein
MKAKECGALLALCALAIASTTWPTRSSAQAPEVKEKPPMYSYVANWSIPRAKWADMEKQAQATEKTLATALSSGALVGYGSDENLVHENEGETHDSFWSGMSMASVLGVLDELRKAATTSPVLNSATKHYDHMFVSRYYNWKAGSIKGGYTHGAMYTLKADAPDDALDTLSKTLIVPLLEKLLASGAIQEYEVDSEAIHTMAPGAFWIYYIAQSADGVDKVNAALRESLKANVLAGPAFGSMVDFSGHRDYLARTNATYK